MKLHLIPLLMVLTALPASALDQVFLESVSPVSPALKAQGGVSTANAEGFDSLFANPAGFTLARPSITVFDLETSALVSFSALSSVLDSRDSWSKDLLDKSSKLLSTLNAVVPAMPVGGEASARMGWVGNGLGVGLVTQGRVTAKGVSNLLDATVTMDQTTMGVIGMAWPFDISLGTVNVGGALRPMQKAYATAPFSAVKSNTTNWAAYDVLSGFGLAWDLGVRWDYANFKTGLAIKDLGTTKLNLKKFTGKQWSEGLSFPSGGTSVSTLYLIPMTIGLGTTWSPDLGALASIVQPSLSFDLQVPIKDENNTTSFWTWTHLGAEAKFLQVYSVRTGLNQGYFTFGLGARLLVVDFNFAVYADELSSHSGQGRRPAISMDWAVRL